MFGKRSTLESANETIATGSVASILATFRRTVDQLTARAAECRAAHADVEKEQQELSQVADKLWKESIAATKAADRIRDLIGEPRTEDGAKQ